jgi:hypothetical protein
MSRPQPTESTPAPIPSTEAMPSAKAQNNETLRNEDRRNPSMEGIASMPASHALNRLTSSSPSKIPRKRAIASTRMKNWGS